MLGPVSGSNPFEGAVVVTVNVAVPDAEPVSEIELGDTVQVASAGAPLHESTTAPLNPPTDGKVTVDVAELPGVIVGGASAEAAIWKSGRGGTEVLNSQTSPASRSAKAAEP